MSEPAAEASSRDGWGRQAARGRTGRKRSRSRAGARARYAAARGVFRGGGGAELHEAEESGGALEEGFGEAEGAFVLPVALERVLDFAAAIEIGGGDPALGPEAVAEDWHGEVAPMDNAGEDLGSEAIAQMPAAVERNEGGDVAVEVRELREHAAPVVEVVAIEDSAPGGAVRGDHGDATLQWKAEQLGIGVGGLDDLDRVLAAGVGKERELQLGHALPERAIPGVGRVDILAIGQALHEHSSRRGAAFQLVDGVGAGGVDAHPSEELRVPTGEIEHCVIRNVHRAEIRAQVAIRFVDLLVREEDDGIDGGRVTNVREQELGVGGIEIAIESLSGDTELPEHEAGKPAVPWGAEAKPSAIRALRVRRGDAAAAI